MNLPKFLFVGTAKAGTTSIYQYLNQHHQISIPVKETFMFLAEIMEHNYLAYPYQRPLSELILDRETYYRTYSSIEEDKIVGEIGTGYLYHYQESIPHIKKYLGEEVKICIILRDPTKRCYSSYLHFKKDLHEKLDFEDSLKAENDRIEDGFDFMWHHFQMGLYSHQVKAYLDAFKNVKVFFFEDLIENTTGFMDELIDFIGASPKKDWKVSRSFNPSGNPKSKNLQRFITQENQVKKIFRPLFRAVLDKKRREKIRKRIKNSNLKHPSKIHPDTEAMLRKAYKNDIRELRGLLNQEIPWS